MGYSSLLSRYYRYCNAIFISYPPRAASSIGTDCSKPQQLIEPSIESQFHVRKSPTHSYHNKRYRRRFVPLLGSYQCSGRQIILSLFSFRSVLLSAWD